MLNKFTIVFMYTDITNIMYDETVFVGTKFIFICCYNDESRRPK